jgi:hypothetical protein
MRNRKVGGAGSEQEGIKIRPGRLGELSALTPSMKRRNLIECKIICG